MNEVAAVVLGVLAIMIPLLGLLVSALYSNMKESHVLLKTELKELKDKAQKSYDSAVDDANETHKELWGEVNKIRDKHHELDSSHKTLCQKHEDHLASLENEIKVLESRLKGDGMFLTARLKECYDELQVIKKQLLNLQLKR